MTNFAKCFIFHVGSVFIEPPDGGVRRRNDHVPCCVGDRFREAWSGERRRNGSPGRGQGSPGEWPPHPSPPPKSSCPRFPHTLSVSPGEVRCFLPVLRIEEPLYWHRNNRTYKHKFVKTQNRCAHTFVPVKNTSLFCAFVSKAVLWTSVCIQVISVDWFSWYALLLCTYMLNLPSNIIDQVLNQKFYKLCTL